MDPAHFTLPISLSVSSTASFETKCLVVIPSSPASCSFLEDVLASWISREAPSFVIVSRGGRKLSIIRMVHSKDIFPSIQVRREMHKEELSQMSGDEL